MKAFKSVLEFAAKEQSIPDSQKEWLRWKEQNTSASSAENANNVESQSTNKRARPSEPSNSSQWKRLVDPKDKVYYFNQTTGESVDEKPKDFIESEESNDDEESNVSSSEEELKTTDEKHEEDLVATAVPPRPKLPAQIWEKKTNSLTRKSEWYCPELDYVLDKMPPEHPWRGVKLPDGRVYFWNTETDETKWI